MKRGKRYEQATTRELPALARLAYGGQGLVIAQPSSETDQGGGPDCSPFSADYLPIG